jgi:hypothetical protein
VTSDPIIISVKDKHKKREHLRQYGIDFPITSYEISDFPGKYFKVLVPADTVTPDKIPMVSYGLKDVGSFLDNNVHKQSSLRRTINPKDSSGFYFIMLYND